MHKNRFCTFTLIAALAIAALPASLAAAGEGGATTSASALSLPVQQNMTLTITPNSSDSYDPKEAAFTAYRVMSFTQQEDGNWVWNVVNGFEIPGNINFSPDALGSYPASKLQNLADRLALQVDENMTDKLDQQTLSNGSCSWTTNKAGIYLVCETQTSPGNFPSEPFLIALPYTDADSDNSWNYSLIASPKGSTIGLEKVISNAAGSYLNTSGHDADIDTVAVGDTVDYRITTRIPAYTDVYFEGTNEPTFQLVDVMAKGLTLTQSSIRLEMDHDPLVCGEDYSQEIGIDDTTGVTTITIDLSGAYLSNAEHHNQELILSFSAVVNDLVSLADNGNENTVTLNYSYDPNHPDDTNQIDDEAVVYSFGIEVEKFDGDSDAQTKTMLQGAEFALFKETSKGCSAASALAQEPYREVGVTDENGILDFRGLDAGTYYLKEVKAPDGYSLLMNPIKIEIIPSPDGSGKEPNKLTSPDYLAKVNGTEVTAGSSAGTSRILSASNREETVVVSAANHHGFTLPNTGGRGIVLILVISAAGLITATFLYVKGGRDKNIKRTVQGN